MLQEALELAGATTIFSVIGLAVARVLYAPGWSPPIVVGSGGNCCSCLLALRLPVSSH